MPSKMTLGIIGVAIIAILSLSFAGYSAMNPHTMTVTGQQYVTNTQFGTVTATATQTMNNSQGMQTVAVGAAVSGNGNGNTNGNAYQMNCGPDEFSYGCNWPYTYDACQGTGVGNGVTCDGYLLKGPNGCVELAVPTDTVQQPPYDHYALQGLPSSYPAMGSWVVVRGQLTLSGASPSAESSSASCPTNSIGVSSIQPTNAPPSP